MFDLLSRLPKRAAPLLIESTDRKKADLKKLTKKISEELMKTNKQLVKLEKEDFCSKSLAELKTKDLAAKLKYHQISDIEITEKLNKAQTVVYQVKGKLSRWAEENQNIFPFVKWLRLNHNNALR